MPVHAQTATIENGFVHLPETAHWLSEYLSEFMLFPNARYDDDSTAQALAWAKQRPAGHAMIESWRRLAEEGGGVARAAGGRRGVSKASL
jgi:phage terminase large subunit-like protein